MPKEFDPKLFQEEIERIVYTQQGRMNYIDAIKHWTEIHDVNIEDTASLVNSKLKAKLRIDFENLNYMRKSGRLPVC
jgi:hypothetical protein